MHNELLSTAEAAALLQVTPSAVSRMVAREELTSQFKAPGKRGPMFFDSKQVEELKAKRDAAAQAQGGAA